LPAAIETGEQPAAPKVLLLIHLRILLQPLCGGAVPRHHALQTSLPDWRGYLISLFALVWVANQYMSIYNHLRLDIKHEQVEIRAKEKEDVVQQRKAA
jgi:hypothetical protein